ncbi:uncharacterized protein LOC131160762 [Malania oleifera]|uniref:uncharacterized protein LOC131160762 n=1 Tax=Malania oleifera TaxID=397392 RepID=UPI0025ADD965|nr:uncharacterized protein LOC131160762 [Malania oleifera]
MENTVVHQETESAVQLYFENQQRQWGDSASEGSVVEVLDRVGINAPSNSLKELRDIWKGWMPQSRLTFSQIYGHIGFLLHMSINPNVIEVLVEFWNPSYCCFTLDGVNLAPTVEKYVSLLHLAKLSTPYKKYVPTQTSIAKEMFKVTEVKVQKLGDSKITWEYLKKLLKMEEGEEAHLFLFALAIYDLLIFPKELGTIDHATIAFVARVKEGANLVHGILSELFWSLNKCRTKRHARLTCCVPLLYVWLQHLVNKGIVWQAPWIEKSKVVYKFENLHWVPLLGPWGGISYAPLMFRSQVGTMQFIPMTHGLADAQFAYEADDSQKKVQEFVVSWRHVHVVESTNQNSRAKESYKLWRLNRVNHRVRQTTKAPTRKKLPKESVHPYERKALKTATKE